MSDSVSATTRRCPCVVGTIVIRRRHNNWSSVYHQTTQADQQRHEEQNIVPLHLCKTLFDNTSQSAGGISVQNSRVSLCFDDYRTMASVYWAMLLRLPRNWLAYRKRQSLWFMFLYYSRQLTVYITSIYVNTNHNLYQQSILLHNEKLVLILYTLLTDIIRIYLLLSMCQYFLIYIHKYVTFSTLYLPKY